MTDLSEFINSTEADDDEFVKAVKKALGRKKTIRIEAIADQLDVSPKRVRDAIKALRDYGYRIPDITDGLVMLDAVPPGPSETIHKLPLALVDGDWIRFGVVSDTHLCSKECALDELHLAYDLFEREGIVDVFHPGDLVAGMGIFPAQHLYITHHSFEDQVDFAVEHYPVRKGVTTHIIGGNHDLEGQFGRSGSDPVKGVANQRPDFNYLGQYSAYVELPNGGSMHLLHGKGGMSYAYSYKAQKVIEGYGQGRKPGALLLGHYHVQGNFSPRAVHTMFPACFEWQSVQFGARLGLRPTVGFHIVEARLGDDGTIVRWKPEFVQFIEGRSIGW
jgi:biotin operon repressor